jgi:peptidoglycan/LPS O-acetylase OafA/YrhL
MPVDATPRSDDPRAEFVVPALRYRPEVDGLRAIAVIFVILFHAGFPLAPSGFIGVDVFFVISGFLITSLLAQELQETGTIRLVGFWARRARRILPAAILVLFASLAFAAPVLGPLQRVAALRDFAAAAVYILNWSLARRATDYFDIETDPSLFLHYWSLSIEEQFYVVWPLLILAAIFFAAKSGRQPRLAALCITITAASLIFCIYLTSRNQPLAFFSTFSRAWELSLGATVALVRLPQLSARVRQGLCAAGLLAILVAGFTFIESMTFPGVAALLPTAGTALILAGGRDVPIGGPLDKALGLTVPVYLGKRSYSWYLWHWPVILIGGAVFGSNPVTVTGFVIASLLLAAATYRFVEQPMRFAPYFTRSAVASVVAGATVSLGAAGFALLAQQTFARPVILLSSGQKLDYYELGADRPALVEPKCLLRHRNTDPAPCIYGDPKGTKRIVLFGDSHAAAWFPALDKAAADAGWQLLVRTKAACPSIDIPVRSSALGGRAYHECAEWRESILKELASSKPNIVVLANSTSQEATDNNGELLKSEDKEEALMAGELAVVRRLLHSGTTSIVLLRDLPRMQVDPRECLLANPGHEEKCSWPKVKTRFPRGSYDDPRVLILDLTDGVCPGAVCELVRDGMVVMRDKAHMTGSFPLTLAPLFKSLFEDKGSP